MHVKTNTSDQRCQKCGCNPGTPHALICYPGCTKDQHTCGSEHVTPGICCRDNLCEVHECTAQTCTCPK